VLSLARPTGDALNKLLDACNYAAVDFGQPELYSGRTPNENNEVRGEDVEPRKKSKVRRRSSSMNDNNEGGNLNLEMEKSIEQRQLSSAAMLATPQDRSDSFHISIAWTLEDPGAVYADLLQSPEVDRFLKKEVGAMKVRFDGVKVKIGNTVSVVPLNIKVDISQGILG